MSAGLSAPTLVRRALCELGHVRNLERLGYEVALDASAGRDSAYACLFGRDSLRMALDLLDDFPSVARTTIRRLTALQGEQFKARAEEEPGRILHEFRYVRDPHAARLGTYWDWPYYGSVDATPLYVILVGAYCQRFGEGLLEERVRRRSGRSGRIRDGVDRALAWIELHLKCTGYVCVRRAQPHGLPNQTWDDSYDSHYRGNGHLLDPRVPYAPVDVQGLAYDALLVGARLANNAQRGRHLQAVARMLRDRTVADFWSPEMSTFAPALVFDPSGPHQTRIVASSPGHLLASRLLDGEDMADKREALMARLLAPDMLAGAGIRTKSTTAPRFSPGAYHNGSVWPMDTGVIADGLRRHGRVAEANDLEDRMLTACLAIGSPVEFFRGERDGSVTINTRTVTVFRESELRVVEQPPQAVQGWTTTRLWRILRRRGLVSAAGGVPVRATFSAEAA